MNHKIKQAFSPLHASEQTLEQVFTMIDTRKKTSKPNFRRILAIASAMILSSAVTVFAADYVISQRRILLFDSTEELAEQYTADNPGYVVGVEIPNTAEENEDLETVAEYVANRMEHGMYSGELFFSDETDDTSDTPWERRRTSSCYDPEYGILHNEYLTGSSYAETAAIEDLLDWDLTPLSAWLTPIEDSQIVSISRKPISNEIMMARALLGYTTANGKRFNLQYNYDEAARLWSGNEYVLNSAYDRVEIYVTNDHVETLIEVYDGQIWARAVNGAHSVSIYTTGCTVEEMHAILDTLSLSEVLRQ